MKTLSTDTCKSIRDFAIEFERRLIAIYLSDILDEEELNAIRTGEYKKRLADVRPARWNFCTEKGDVNGRR